MVSIPTFSCFSHLTCFLSHCLTFQGDLFKTSVVSHHTQNKIQSPHHPSEPLLPTPSFLSDTLSHLVFLNRPGTCLPQGLSKCCSLSLACAGTDVSPRSSKSLLLPRPRGYLLLIPVGFVCSLYHFLACRVLSLVNPRGFVWFFVA